MKIDCHVGILNSILYRLCSEQNHHAAIVIVVAAHRFNVQQIG